MLLVAEILGDGQRGQRDPPAGARRLVHLPVNQDGTGENAGTLHIGQQLVPLAGPFADPGKDRDALVFLDHRVDQFHDQDCLADSGAAEHCGLAALRQRGEQIDDLDACLEHGRCGRLLRQRRRRTVQTTTRRIFGQWFAAVP